jgi:TATA-box binding protein (TBP) (component of TFIID and TFIIIB)
VSSLGRPVDIHSFCSLCDISNDIVYVEYGDTKFECVSRGLKPSKHTSKKKKEKKTATRFDNQSTIIIQVDYNKFINVKLFNNGNIQLTGARTLDDGNNAINIIHNQILNTNSYVINTEDDNQLIHIIDNDFIEIYDNDNDNDNNNDNDNDNDNTHKYNNIKPLPCKPVLINANFKISYKIKRSTLFDLLSKQYKVFTGFEPCIYPGVKIMYYWNKTNTDTGICKCTQKCTSSKWNNCKKITIAVFQSGNIIITGANQHQQIDDCYNFLKKIFIQYEQQLKCIEKTHNDDNKNNNEEEEIFLIMSSKLQK